MAQRNFQTLHGSPTLRINEKNNQDIKRAISSITSGYKVLILLRGMPGSGKSHLALNILEKSMNANCDVKQHILSTDDFFIKNNVYNYNQSKISEAHGWNHNRAFLAMSKGLSPVIIDNTNTQMWEMKPYATMATDFGYIIEILEPDNSWRFNERELVRRNNHGVARAQIRNMLERYERNITVAKLLSAYSLQYKRHKLPVYRDSPPLNKDIVSNVLLNGYSCSLKSHLIKDQPGATYDVKSSYPNSLYEDAVKYQSDNKIASADTINLMNFNDDNSSSSEPLQWTNFNKIKKKSAASVDDLLLINDSSTSSNKQNNGTKEIERSLIKRNESHPTNILSSIESIWGTNAEKIQSWDLVMPLLEPDPPFYNSLPMVPSSYYISTKECSTVIEKDIFAHIDSNIDELETVYNLKIIKTSNRNINASTTIKPKGIQKKTCVDKSCLTEEYFENMEDDLIKLQNMFPDYQLVNLTYCYKKYKGDIGCAIDYLLQCEPDNISSSFENLAFDEPPKNISSIKKSVSPKKHSKKKIISKLDMETKKSIENKVKINKDCYSETIQKLKGLNVAIPTNANENNDTSCNVFEDLMDDDIYELYCGELNNFACDENQISPSTSVIELNLGENMVQQLESQFGDSNLSIPQGFQPVVQMPVTLARQLYTFYLESVFQQMENQKQVFDDLVKEDESFAKRLWAQETNLENCVELTTPDLKSIMKEHAAQHIYEREINQWKNLTPDTFASRLIKKKLFENFPNIEKDIILEILQANNNSYQDTVDSILTSIGETAKENIRESPINNEIIQDLEEAHSLIFDIKENKDYKPEDYRNIATNFLTKRQELYLKAKEYFQKDMKDVAQYYSDLAAKQTGFYEKANNLAASAWIEHHSKRLQNLNTIDLHYFYVKEAIPLLDIFLDRSIVTLRKSRKEIEKLQIITGRGKNSPNGISKIKPAVINHLQKRSVRFVILNPGLLKVVVSKNSLLSNEMCTK